MTDAHATDQPGHVEAAAHHATDDHGDDHGHDDHAHGGDEATLGPIDTLAWGAGLLGIVAALVIVAAFVMATGGAAPVAH